LAYNAARPNPKTTLRLNHKVRCLTSKTIISLVSGRNIVYLSASWLFTNSFC
jgi:hypothetical protein